MWRIGLILLFFSRIESLQCPERCHCIQTSQRNKNDTSVIPTFQITCREVRDLPELLQKLPTATTQLIVQLAQFNTPRNLHKALAEAAQVLPHLTDFSIINSVVSSQGDQLIKEFLPFASITNPVLKGTGFSQLQILNLSNNTLKYLPAGLFRSCSSLQTLDLSGNLIKNFETDTFHPLINLLRLDLRRNRLQSLSEDVFRNLTKLVTLDVSQNEITSIKPTTFQYLTSLNTLILSRNPLASGIVLLGAGRHLQIVDLSGTGLHQAPTTLERTVRTLSLKENQLSAVRCGDLDSYSLVTVLYLDSNHISYVEEDAMGRLELLTELHLSRNKLFHVPRSLPENLFLIDLSFNLIQNVSNSDFLNLSLLKELSLSNNQIRHVEENSFANLVSLAVLDLSRNPILVLPPLIGLNQLKVLNLSYLTNVSRAWRLGLRTFPVPNPTVIEELNLEASPALSSLFLSDTATLQQFYNLTDLHLKFSNLSTLPSDFFILLPSLVTLSLEGNPWHCDKEMLPAAEWMRSQYVGHKGPAEHEIGNSVNAMHCATPGFLHGKPLIALSENDVLAVHSSFSHFENSKEHELSKAQSGLKDAEENPVKPGIYSQSLENSIDSIDNGFGEIEKTSNALRGYQRRTTLTPVEAATRGDNHKLSDSNASNSDSRPHEKITNSPSFPATIPTMFHDELSTAKYVESTKMSSVKPRTSVVPSGVLPTIETIVIDNNVTESWKTSKQSHSRLSSRISSRLVSEQEKNNSLGSDESFDSDSKRAGERRNVHQQEADRKGTAMERGDKSPLPRETESTSRDLGEALLWNDSSPVLAANNSDTAANNTGADALSAVASASHPGLLVVTVIAVVVALAFALMVHQIRRKTRDQGYILHEEMEVHTISHLHNELW